MYINTVEYNHITSSKLSFLNITYSTGYSYVELTSSYMNKMEQIVKFIIHANIPLATSS